MYKSIITKRPRNYMVIDYRDDIKNRFKERFDRVLPYLADKSENESDDEEKPMKIKGKKK
jgi:hypothetical protein